MTARRPTPARWGQVAARDPVELAEPARVLRVICDFFTARPAARDHLAGFAFAGLRPVDGTRGACFWTEELLDHLDHVTIDLTAPADGGSPR